MPQYVYHELGHNFPTTGAPDAVCKCGSDVAMIPQRVVHILGYAMCDQFDIHLR